ncbi:hypothetical protein ACFSYD_17370 [Paracoccus aerius]
MIDWTIVREMLPAFWHGLQMTLLLLVTSAVAGLLLSVPLSVARSARSPWARWPVFGFTFVIRGRRFWCSCSSCITGCRNSG